MKSFSSGREARFATFLAALAYAALSSANIEAQAPMARTVTLAEVYDLAARSPRVAAASALATAAEARVASAKRPPDPELQVGLMNRSMPSLEPMELLGMTQVQLMQMVPTPGKLRLAGRIAAARADAAGARAGEIEWEVRARAAMAFYDLFSAGEQLDIAQKTKLLVEDIARVSRSMYSVGDGRQSDVLRAQVEVARMSEDIVRMQGMRAAMAGRLASIIDLPADTSLEAAPPPRLPETLLSLAELISESERNRLMITAGEREVNATDAEVQLARKEIWPDFQIGLQYAWRGGPMGTERMGSLMIGATLPVFARSRQLSMRREAGAMRAMASADVAAMRAETRGRMTELYADFTRAGNLVRLYRTTILPQAEGAVTASFSAYRVGSVDLMTLLDNQMAVNRYRQELVSLEAGAGTALAEMEMLLARELFDASEKGRIEQ